MKNSIRTKKILFMVFSLLLTYPMRMLYAQEKNPVLNKMENTKNETQTAVSIIPQKPEDISPLLNGEKIPAAILPDASGKDVDLNKMVSQKPTILIFYRGGWCPFCSQQLSGLQEAAPELERLGYQLIAISTDAPEGLMQSAMKEKLSYTLLSDADLRLSQKFGIAYKAPKEYGEMLPKTTAGKNSNLLLPVPSVFILDKTGVIHFEYINPDFKQRLKPGLLTEVANSLVKDL